MQRAHKQVKVVGGRRVAGPPRKKGLSVDEVRRRKQDDKEQREREQRRAKVRGVLTCVHVYPGLHYHACLGLPSCMATP